MTLAAQIKNAAHKLELADKALGRAAKGGEHKIFERMFERWCAINNHHNALLVAQQRRKGR